MTNSNRDTGKIVTIWVVIPATYFIIHKFNRTSLLFLFLLPYYISQKTRGPYVAYFRRTREIWYPETEQLETRYSWRSNPGKEISPTWKRSICDLGDICKAISIIRCIHPHGCYFISLHFIKNYQINKFVRDELLSIRLHSSGTYTLHYISVVRCFSKND